MSISAMRSSASKSIQPAATTKAKVPDLKAFDKLVREVFYKHGRHLSLGRIVARNPGDVPYFLVETNAVLERSAKFVMTRLIENAVQGHKTLKGATFALVGRGSF